MQNKVKEYKSSTYESADLSRFSSKMDLTSEHSTYRCFLHASGFSIYIRIIFDLYLTYIRKGAETRNKSNGRKLCIYAFDTIDEKQSIYTGSAKARQETRQIVHDNL